MNRCGSTIHQSFKRCKYRTSNDATTFILICINIITWTKKSIEQTSLMLNEFKGLEMYYNKISCLPHSFFLSGILMNIINTLSPYRLFFGARSILFSSLSYNLHWYNSIFFASGAIFGVLHGLNGIFWLKAALSYVTKAKVNQINCFHHHRITESHEIAEDQIGTFSLFVFIAAQFYYFIEEGKINGGKNQIVEWCGEWLCLIW